MFSTYFLFGPHKAVQSDSDDIIGDIIDGLFGEDDDKKNEQIHSRRALNPSHELDKSEPHLLIRGQISFVNSFGFLNADQYPLMQFYLIMFFLYMVASGYWIRLMRSN
jgi:hypothetical protein